MPDAPSALRVSVIVPTWRSGAGLERLLTSLDAQSLEPDRYEVLLIDDGSPAEDFARITAIAERHRNVAVTRIDHSGWPSRPRNVGIDLATGDYVLFADHDDELYPDSLRVAVETLERTGADVFAGKEARTDQAKWALTTFDRDVDDATERTDVHALAPANPHKLYRTAMLREHGIRFPEGGRRLWEDVVFNADVARVADGVSIRSDEPFYHWVREGSTTSTTFVQDDIEWWDSLAGVVDHIARPAVGGEVDPQRRLLLEIQFRERILPAVGPGLLDRPAERRRGILERAAALVERHWDPELEARTPVHLLARVRLLQAGRLDLVEELAAWDRGLRGVTFARAATIGEAIELRTSTTWMTRHGGFLAIEIAEDGSVRRRLPSRLREALDPGLLDLDRDLGVADVRIGVRSRETKMTWLVPTETTVSVSPTPGYPDVTATSIARIDPGSLRLGRPMAPGYWDVNARTELFGVVNHRAIRGLGLAVRNAPARLYTNVHGNLSLKYG